MSFIKEMTNLIEDTLSNKVKFFANDNASQYADEAIRQGFLSELGGELTWQTWRNNKNKILTVFENVLNTNLPKAWDISPFYRQLVESKNGALGEKNEFVVNNPGTLVVSRTSGNHWYTDRQKLQGKRVFSLSTDWIYIRVYDDFEKFVKGYTTIGQLMEAIQRGFQTDMDARVFAAFNGAGTYLPEKFKETGTYDEDKMRELVQRVSTAAQSNVILAGSKSALSRIHRGLNADFISERQKDEIATNGCLITQTGLGVPAIEIPQAFIRGTYDFLVDNKTIYVLSANDKPIKQYFEGDTRALDLTEHQTGDMTIDSQVQTKVGVGVVFSDLFGKYTVE